MSVLQAIRTQPERANTNESSISERRYQPKRYSAYNTKNCCNARCRATGTHPASARFAARYEDIEVADRNLVLDDGDVISAGGILAWTDLGLTLVERLFGRGTMLSTARFLVVQPPRASQLPFTEFVPDFDHGDEAILRVQHHIHANLTASLIVDDLAGLAQLGNRTFMRRFAKATAFNPTEYIQQARVAKARGILELTNRPMDQIAWEVGYKDPSGFSKIFQRISGVSASKYRQQFGAAPARPWS